MKKSEKVDQEDLGNQEKQGNQDDSMFVRGGLIGLLIKLFSFSKNSEINLQKAALFLALVSWLPIAILSSIFSSSQVPEQTITFAEDFFVHVRFLIVLPFLILMVQPVDKSFSMFIQNTDHLLKDGQEDKYQRLQERIQKLLGTILPDLVVLSLVYLFTFFNWNDMNILGSNRDYLVHEPDVITPAGWYYLLISSPLLQLILFRWVWRWSVWFYTTYRITKLQLDIDPLHADQVAGLEYVNLTPLSFSLILMAPSAILASMIGMSIVYSGAEITDYALQITAYVLFLPIILYSPLFSYAPLLVKARTFGIIRFGDLIREHDKLYTAKWLSDSKPNDRELLGSADHSSLADINGSYQSVQNMRTVPISLKMITSSVILNLLPYIPLVFTYYSASELFKLLITNVFGT